MKRALFAAALALLGATAGAPQPQDGQDLTTEQARVVARQALQAGRFDLARDIGLALVRADPEDSFAYGVLAAAHARLDDPKLARAAARLAYRHSDTPDKKFGAARTAARIAYQQERHTVSQAWLRLAATHAGTDEQDQLLARDYGQVRASNPLSFNLKLSLAPSDNVNNGTDNVLEVINGVPTSGVYNGSSRALSGLVGTADARLRYRLRAGDASRTTATGRLYTRQVDLTSSAQAQAPDVSNSDLASTVVEAGIEHLFAFGAPGNSVTVAGAVGASWSGGDRSHDYGKLTLKRGLRLSPASRLTFSGTVERQLSTISAARDADVLTLGASFSHKLEGGDRLHLGLTVQDVSSDFINRSYQTASFQANYTFAKRLGPAQVTTGLTFGYTDYATYLLVNPVDGGRQDTSIYGDVSLFFADYDFAGFAPTVQLRTGRRSSNVNRFEISETTISVGFQSKF